MATDMSHALLNIFFLFKVKKESANNIHLVLQMVYQKKKKIITEVNKYSMY